MHGPINIRCTKVALDLFQNVEVACLFLLTKNFFLILLNPTQKSFSTDDKQTTH